MKEKKIIEVLIKYLKECNRLKEIYTFRGLISFLNDHGVKLSYFEAQEMGLLDFNNELFDLIKKQ